MRIGVRAHDFGKLPADILAEKIAMKGLASVQLTLEEAISDIDASYGKLNTGIAYSIGETFRKHNLQIAVLSCYINPIHPDVNIRIRNLERFKEFIRFARDFGCSIIGTETGSVNEDVSFDIRNHSEENYQLFMSSLKELVEEAEKFGVFVGIEGVERFVINSPHRVKRMLDEVKSNHVQIIFDPLNLLSPENHSDRDKIIKDSFELFGDRIAIFHAKDYIIENGKIKSVQLGEGLMNYELIGRLIEAHKPYLNIIMEDVEVSKVERSISYLEKFLRR